MNVLPACGGILRGESGSLAYPSDSSQTYRNGVNCYWRIVTSRNKVLLSQCCQGRKHPVQQTCSHKIRDRGTNILPSFYVNSSNPLFICLKMRGNLGNAADML